MGGDEASCRKSSPNQWYYSIFVIEWLHSGVEHGMRWLLWRKESPNQKAVEIQAFRFCLLPHTLPSREEVQIIANRLSRHQHLNHGRSVQ